MSCHAWLFPIFFAAPIVAATSWKLFKYEVFSGSYFPVFSLNAGKYGPEKTLYLDNFHKCVI